MNILLNTLGDPMPTSIPTPPPTPRLARSMLSLCLFLLVAACAPAPSPSSVTPTATGSTQAATITAYHGHTSTVFAVAWSPDGTRIASGGNDNTVLTARCRCGMRRAGICS